jgi:F0F1-type ATP synthase membrane subunit b/b'
VEENIEKLKNMFERRITELQTQISRSDENTVNRVREIMQDGNEKICEEITIKNAE